MQVYSDMKDSGVEWLGRIPQEWSLSKISANFRRKKIRGMVNEELLSVYRDYGVVIKSSRDDNHNAASEDLSNYQLVEAGDLVTNKMKTWQGSIAISEYRGIVSPAYFILSPTSTKMVPKYIHYLLRSPIYIAQYNRFSKGIRIGQWDLEYERFKTFPLLLPPHEIQHKIADFLDTETAQIDNLIAKQERLLELLEEKRRATITHAVTRGLNPNIELKETNIPWLNQIPQHWNVVRIGRLFRENRSTNSDLSSLAPMKFGFGKIVQKPFTPDEESREELRRYILIKPKDIIVNGLNLNYDFVTQRVAMVEKEGCMTPAYISLRGRSEDIMPKFYNYTLKSLDSQKVLNGWGTGIRLTLNYSELKKKELPQPSIEEQRAIVEHLDGFIAKSDELKQKIQTQITLLRERRTSLISHAVTGMVKV